RRIETTDAGNERVTDCGNTPGSDRNRITNFCAAPINQPAENQQAHRVGTLEKPVGQAELFVGPVQLVVQDRLDQSEYLPVNIVDGRCKEEQGADYPTIVGAHN